MTPLLLTAWVLAQSPAADGHMKANPLFRTLVSEGVATTADGKVKLPPPAMADGLTGPQQKQVIETVIGADYSFRDFTRASVVAPYLLLLDDVKPSDPTAPAKSVDAYFVVYGDFAATDDTAFLDNVLSLGRGNGDGGTTLTPADLKAREITVPNGAGNARESFGHVTFDVLDRVRLSVTGRAVWTKTEDSVVAAVHVDPRFRGDEKFPNRWRPLTRAGGRLTPGEPHPYGGAALYVKMTRLSEPAGAIFVEEHVVFTEPVGWFDGANLLRSKLPPVIQSNVRSLRKEWIMAGE